MIYQALFSSLWEWFVTRCKRMNEYALMPIKQNTIPDTSSGVPIVINNMVTKPELIALASGDQLSLQINLSTL